MEVFSLDVYVQLPLEAELKKVIVIITFLGGINVGFLLRLY